ncbi:MAG: toll/interleukin-1 receptor domain-containing protein, partial [Lachnospiraceae bacterium]|nr:toll/interleukin-1 receptor domain-containing protein [Lachnospiraceae bacterium]
MKKNDVSKVEIKMSLKSQAVKPKSYEGDKPYIFISYSHRDSKIVWPIIEQLNKDGYRVWYDDGIDPGTEWDQFIADKVCNSGCFLAFMSEAYL